ncbi:VOC family protein [Elizabethkingia meningoseptica]|uniref:VOC family protein n=1 Tax=Elizabethkingia meningoseptica TaxID=238 RepID=A0A1V3TY54_ELIME|nr:MULTISPECIES: VOC family protein [Elizabethkingia]AQX05496.1 glyoxalase [Elizabethkingia meningoseptica]AQX13047.1 glyoxalase [Elizabethkingia meningoseptica]AQX47540.1 glyoxalase [Elizabethkingia meningoseptica]EJK5328751.1 VOC family protein [Elizabethkingia meningoseptica]EOR30363.1 Glyoxalase/bleomycin resistance protein/dioxygenase [Elizabethkingia meningoseptica ATCC 13253 = NBRC 12535]
MPKLNPYLNFDGKAEEAFNFYKSVFGGEFLGEVHKMGNAPGTENLSEEAKNRVMHIALPVGGDLLMASDIVPEFGQSLQLGNNNYVSIFPDSREEADRLFKGLSEGGTIEMPLEDQFWGDYFGCFTDKFDVKWMINYSNDRGYENK